jgi:hypothetical protein
MNMEDGYENIIKLFNLFKNRPYHLLKYLIKNSALKESFIKKIKNSKISELEDSNLFFLSIEEMNNYYQSILDMKISEEKSKEDIEIELNKKLDDCIRSENYEEASRIRDFMKIKKIKRIFKN